MQKTIGALYLHNSLHSQKDPFHSSASHLPVIITDPGSCTCIDDFCVPFTTTLLQVDEPLPVIETEFIAALESSTSFAVKVFHSLRGPPSVMA